MDKPEPEVRVKIRCRKCGHREKAWKHLLRGVYSYQCVCGHWVVVPRALSGIWPEGE